MLTLNHFRSFFCFIIATLTIPAAWGQSVQTLRGRITDEVSQTPLIGVTVRLEGDANTGLGATTDDDGNYRIERVPVGRQTVIISYIGYETRSVPNIVVTAGKEIILNITLQESIMELNEVTVTSDNHSDKTATNNDLAMVSSRSFNTDDTKRYAGALGDPSRMAANFAGVVGGNDSRNDIVVRGNSPMGMLWQLEGLNIPNPNHFGALVSTGGPVSMLNNNNIDKSDFITSAFPAQYGNATAGVFDLRLRNGNNETSEFVGQIGFNGFEAGAEGPLSKKAGSSYIVNYRYSTLGLFNALGIEFGTGSNTPLYQDLNFKLSWPTRGKGTLSIFGIGGTSSIDLLGSEADLSDDNSLYGSENTDSYPRYRTGIAGISYERTISEKTYTRIVAGISATHEEFTTDSLVRNTQQEVVDRYLSHEVAYGTQKYSVNFLTRTKFNARNSITSGFTADVTDFDLYQHERFPNVSKDTVRLDVNDLTVLYQAYSTWKHRFNQRWAMQAGVHAQYYDLNEQWAVEPRLGLQFIPGDGRQVLSIGYGIHNQAQNLTTSFTQTRHGDQSVLTNKDLGFTTSHHAVFTYDWNISEYLRLKAEVYYQSLNNIPVEQRPTSYAAINTGASFLPSGRDSLVNEGTGNNYGVELTLERFFNRGYYFLITTSLFNSRYSGSDDVERNTAYNTNYVFNVLAGKEWALRRGRFLSLSLKLTTIGGPYLTPINVEESRARGRTVYRESEAFSERQRAYFRSDLRISYRKEYRKTTLEVSLDLQNLTNNQNIFSQSYNYRTNSVMTQYQQSFFPVPYVKFTF
ncbi:MAG TPA: TonB-dependent receptor [Chryseolinea sp.]|nr:TonB-dependent receptor [Chryseolinea sp.]